MFSLDLISFILSSLITLAAIFYNLPVVILHQVIALLLVILVLISRKYSADISTRSNKLFRVILITLSSLFVQLIVISSGGFYSPFLILLHLYTLGISFLLNISSAVVFLILSITVLLVGTFLNKTLMIIFRQDPASAVLYFVSFVVVVPLAQYLMRTYHLKDTVSKILTEHILMGEKREQSILRGLTELVIITDANLNILSVNEAVEKSLQISKIDSSTNLLNFINLVDEKGNRATSEELALNQIMADRATRYIEGFYLQIKPTESTKVVIQIRPIVNAAGSINQLVFVITEARLTSSNGQHLNFDQAREKEKQMAQNLKLGLQKANLPDLALQAQIFSKTDEDLITALEIEDHPIEEKKGYEDLAGLCERIIASSGEFAGSLGVKIQFILPKEEVAESTLLSLKKSSFPEQNLPLSDFAVPLDPKWFELMVQKLLDISLFMASVDKNGTVSLLISRPDPKSIAVTIIGSAPNLALGDEEKLFVPFFGDLAAKTNLKLGSGLEGFIAKTIAKALDLTIDPKIEGGNLTFQLKVSKKP